ncbi:MAG TPA: GGDEF domain-containing protein [Actinoplanes sp.]|nr:GGDEF domain-containing protein [Actinoplanes sp.]
MHAQTTHAAAVAADLAGVDTTSGSTVRLRWYALGAAALLAGFPLLPTTARAVVVCVVSGATVVPLLVIPARQRLRDRLPWLLLALAMAVLTVGNVLSNFGGPPQQLNAEILITASQGVVLLAAVALVLRRGCNDIGGLLDVSVAAIVLGGLLWTVLLQPNLESAKTGPGEQVAVLVSMLLLAGVLGALGRVWLVGNRRLPALRLLVCALLLAMIGNVAQVLTQGSMTNGTPAWIELIFLATYLCIGATPLHPSMHELARPGPAPTERLSIGRLVFLGAVLVANPLVGGVQQMIGGAADGPLLAVGSLLAAPLVMIRVGRLAHQREHAERALQHQATHDILTGLPNRAELLSRLEAALHRERLAGRPAVVLLFCDLNGFKEVNDRLGHVAGDLLLTEVGKRIRDGLRAGDTVARYGGDEFLVLCEEVAQQRAVARLCGHIETVLAVPFLVNGEPLRISSSIGAVVSDGDCHADDLITRADQAMYRAKQRRRAEVA